MVKVWLCQRRYSKAYTAIIDANLTTLLTAIVLYSFGSGSIRGFATTLIIGIFTSLFSAIVITRPIFFSRLESKKTSLLLLTSQRIGSLT